MTMDADLFQEIPPETAKVARAIFSRSNFYRIVGDQANEIFSSFPWQAGFNPPVMDRGSLVRLYLITVFQFKEAISDQSAAEALQNRVDWKYALHLPLDNPGWEAAAFCYFRQWLLAEPSRLQDLQNLITRLRRAVKLSGTAPFDPRSEQIVTRICWISRLEEIFAAVNRVLEAIASQQPELLGEISLAQSYAYYREKLRHFNLRADTSEQEAFAQMLGTEGQHLLDVISDRDTPTLADLPDIKALKQVWQDQFELVNGKTYWRNEACAHCPSNTRNYFIKDISANTNRRTYES
jgi:transposase